LRTRPSANDCGITSGPNRPQQEEESKHMTIHHSPALPRQRFTVIHPRLILLVSFTAALWLANQPPTQAGEFASDFNSGSVPGAQLYGSASIDSTGGADGSGALKLTIADYDQIGSFIVDELDGGAAMTGFTAEFKLLIGGGSGADGFSFNFANDLPDAPIWEEGAGSGLRFIFDTFNNGADAAPVIDIKSGDRLLWTFPLFLTGNYFDVFINLDPDGTLDLKVNNLGQ